VSGSSYECSRVLIICAFMRRQIDDLNIKIGGIQHDLEQLTKTEREKEKELESAKAASEKAELAQRRVKTASQTREIFAKILALRDGRRAPGT
jgi:hypothetical protein